MNLLDKQFTTFYLDNRLYGIDVLKVQEVIPKLPITVIRSVPKFVKGLINLRGQIATEIGLSDLLGVKNNSDESHSVSVVCKIDHDLFSFRVDRIGDVISVPESEFELPPKTIDEKYRKFINGVYKINGAILSVIEVEKIFEEFTKLQK